MSNIEENVDFDEAKDSRPASPLAVALRRLATLWATPGVGRAGICSPLVGVVAGLGAVGFLLALQFMYSHVLGGLMHLTIPPTPEGEAGPVSYPRPWWIVILVPTVGGLISGWLVFTFAPEAEGHGTDAMIKSFHRGGGMIRTRVPFIKTIASIVTIGTGGSAGQEGPIAQIGAGFGSYLARALRLSASERRILMLAGAAGGVGAIFRAPLGGALFAGEVLYSSTAFESAALLPCLASAIIAYSTFALFVTPRPVFSMPPLTFQGLADLPMYVGLTLLCAGGGWLYTRTFYGPRDRLFKPLPIPTSLKPALGGAMVGFVALVFPQVALLGSDSWGPLVIADDLATRPVATVTASDHLHTALRRMTELNTDEIPVVDGDEPTRLVGLLSRRALTSAYTLQIESLRSGPETAPASTDA